jgi:site-specific recombinase XerC
VGGSTGERGGPDVCHADGTRYSDRNVRRVLGSAAERADVPWIGFHTFRHTCASMLFSNGKNIKQVAVWLGHADPAFTLRTYVHLMDDGLGDVDFLDEAVSPSAPRETRTPREQGSPTPSTAENACYRSVAEST